MKRRPPVKLTQRSLTAIVNQAKGKSDFTLWDLLIPGFGLRLRHSARGPTLTWILQYEFDRRDWRMKIGNGCMSCEDARTEAGNLMNRVHRARNGEGVHPAKVRDQQKAYIPPPKPLTFASHVEAYLQTRKPVVRDSTYEEIRRYLQDGFKVLGPHDLPSIERRHIAVELNAIASASGAASANRARSAISKFYKWAIGEGLCEANPVRDTNLNEGENKRRERVLKGAEIAAVWTNCPNNDYGNILKLILLTGTRRGEIGGLKWSEIDLEARTITLPGERTKNKRTHIIPLSDTALALLSGIERRGDSVFGKRATGFSGWSKPKRELDAVVKFEHWTVHDLRRTVSTGMNEIGILPHIVEAVINHTSGHKGGVAGRYNHAEYFEDKKSALDRWAHHLKTIVAQATGANVTTLKKKRH